MEVPRKHRRLDSKNSTRHGRAATKGNMHAETDDETKNVQQTSTCRIKGNIAGVARLYFIITENSEIKRCVDKTGWTQFLSRHAAKSDQASLFELVKRWSPKTHTFQLPNVELGITPYDFTNLTGIAIGTGTRLPPYSISGYSDYCATMSLYLPGYDRFQAYYERAGLRISGLNQYITQIYNGGNILVSVEVISRAFCMYMLGSLFFPNGAASVGIGWLNYLLSMDEVGTYDWGTAILARIYLALDRCKQDGIKGIFCFWQLIEHYLFEYFSPSRSKLGDPYDQLWPRMLDWRRDYQISAHKQLEFGSPQSISWTSFLPFRDKFPYVTEAYNISLTRHMLLDPQRVAGSAYYLGERCVRQLTGLIAIPIDPPTSMTGIDLTSDLHLLVDVEKLRYDKLSRQASQCEYDAYYSDVARLGEPICMDGPRKHRKLDSKNLTKHEGAMKKGHMHGESDDETTNVQQTSTCQIRGNMRGVSRLYFIITENSEIKHCVDKTGWTQFLSRHAAKSDPASVFNLVNRWSPATHTFQLPHVELGITPYDFTTLTGIAVGSGTKLPPYSVSEYGDYSATISSYLPGFDCFQANYQRGGLRVSRLNEYITHIYNGGNILVSVEVISRAFCMHMLGSLFFPGGDATVGIGSLNCLLVMDEVGTYDWGTAILARIYLTLNRYKQNGIKNIFCFWQLIEHYIFEYFSTPCSELVDPSDQLWPRMLRWRRYKQTSAHKQLEFASSQSITWTAFLPFKDKFPYVTEAYNTSLSRHTLLDPRRGAVYYLGERCVRQLTGLIAIPVDPPTLMAGIDPTSLLHSRMDVEELRYDKLSIQASQHEYDAYYSNVVRLGEPLHEYVVNTDVVGKVANYIPEIIIPTVQALAAEGGKCHKQSSQPGESTVQALATKVGKCHRKSSQPGVSIKSIDTLMPDWMMPSLDSSGAVTMVPVPRPTNSFKAPLATSFTHQQWRKVYVEYVDYSSSLWHTIVDREHQLYQQALQMDRNDAAIKERDAEIARLARNAGSQPG